MATQKKTGSRKGATAKKSARKRTSERKSLKLMHNRIATISLTLALVLPPLGSSLAGAPTPEDVSQVASFLFVQNTNSGSFRDGRLTLTGSAPVLFFSDRPYRISGHTTLRRFLDAWASGEDSFAADPPNGVLSILGDQVESFVVVLSDPQLNSNGMSYHVEVAEGTIPKKFGEASLFIDNNLWAAVGGLAVGRHSAKKQSAKEAAAFSAGQDSAAMQDQDTYYQANSAPAPATSASAAPATGNQSSEQQLEQLKQMLDKGLITQDDYDAKKKELLSAM